MLSIFLLLKLFCPVNIRVGDFDPVNDDAQASDDLGDERFFFDAVTVAERVPVKQDIAGDGFSIDRKKACTPKRRSDGKKRGSVSSRGALLSEPGRIRYVPKSFGTFQPKRT